MLKSGKKLSGTQLAVFERHTLYYEQIFLILLYFNFYNG